MHPKLEKMADINSLNTIHFNEFLLANLHLILGMPRAEVAVAARIAVTTWYRITKEPQRLTVQQLLDISNGLHIPVRHFFSDRKITGTINRKDYVVNYDYKNCYYDSDAVRKLIKESTTISWKDAADVTGIHAFRVKESLLAVYRLPVTRLINFCNAFDLNIFDYIIDPNAPVKSNEIEASTTSFAPTAYDAEEKTENNSSMRLEIYELRRQLYDTRQELAYLRQKQNPNNMLRNEIKAPVTFFSGMRVLYDTKDLTEPLRTWFQKLTVKTPYDTFFFAKTGAEYNSVRFFTEDGIMFYEAKCDSDLANLLFREGIMPGKISADSMREDTTIIELRVDLVANAREDRADTADLAKFREKMIQKFG